MDILKKIIEESMPIFTKEDLLKAYPPVSENEFGKKSFYYLGLLYKTIGMLIFFIAAATFVILKADFVKSILAPMYNANRNQFYFVAVIGAATICYSLFRFIRTIADVVTFEVIEAVVNVENVSYQTYSEAEMKKMGYIGVDRNSHRAPKKVCLWLKDESSDTKFKLYPKERRAADKVYEEISQLKIYYTKYNREILYYQYLG